MSVMNNNIIKEEYYTVAAWMIHMGCFSLHYYQYRSIPGRDLFCDVEGIHDYGPWAHKEPKKYTVSFKILGGRQYSSVREYLTKNSDDDMLEQFATSLAYLYECCSTTAYFDLKEGVRMYGVERGYFPDVTENNFEETKEPIKGSLITLTIQN